MKKGCVQIYTGEGKGKTTAAFGLLARALGRGLRACVFQFLKCGDSGETLFFKKTSPECEIVCAGFRGFYPLMSEEEKKKAVAAVHALFERAQYAVACGGYDMVILDEILGAVENGMLAPGDVLNMLDGRHEGTEVVLTGRALPEEIASRAALVTDMRCVRHYFDAGMKAREGMEY